MEDMNWKTWALIFIIAMGASLEAIKRLPGKGSALDLENSTVTGTPYNVKLKNAPMTLGMPAQKLGAPKAMIIGGQTISRETLEKFVAANTPAKTEFDHTMKGAEAKVAAKKKKKGDDEYEIIVDPKTGKKYRRKKKKTAKLEPKVEEIAKVEPKKEEEPKHEDDNFDNLMQQAISTGQLPPAPVKADSPYADLEEWKRRLLTRPDVAETRRFIEHFQNSIVSADIFYKITSMMIEDSRPQMKELGVLCAGSTPSVLSFTLLADIVKAERTGNTTRVYAEGFLARYSDQSNLGTLKQILRSPSSSNVAILAAKKLDVAANTILDKKKNNPPKNPTSSQTVTKHSNAGYFSEFITILNSMVRGTDPAVVEQAKSSLAHLQLLINLGADPGQNPPTQAPVQASMERW